MQDDDLESLGGLAGFMPDASHIAGSLSGMAGAWELPYLQQPSAAVGMQQGSQGGRGADGLSSVPVPDGLSVSPRQYSSATVTPRANSSFISVLSPFPAQASGLDTPIRGGSGGAGACSGADGDSSQRPRQGSKMLRSVQNAVSIFRGGSGASGVSAAVGSSHSPCHSSAGGMAAAAPGDGVLSGLFPAGHPSAAARTTPQPSPFSTPKGSPRGTPRTSIEGDTQSFPIPILSTRLTYQPPSSFARAQRRSSVVHAVRMFD